MMTAFNGIQINNIGIKNTDSRVQNENTDAASEIFAGMLGQARPSGSETMTTGPISPTGSKGRSSNKGHAISSCKLLKQDARTAPCEERLTAQRSFPGRVGLQTTDAGGAQSKTAHIRMSPDPGAIHPAAASGLPESMHHQAAVGKNGFIKETDTVSGKTVKSGLQKATSTTGVFGKNEATTGTPAGAEEKTTGSKDSTAGLDAAGLKHSRASRHPHGQGITATENTGPHAGAGGKITAGEKTGAGLPDTGLKQTPLTHQHQGPEDTAGKNAKTPIRAEKIIPGNEKIAVDPPNADLKQTRLAHQHQGSENSTGNQNFNIETAPPVKNRTPGTPPREKNDAVTRLKGDKGEKPTEIKGGVSNPTGEKIIFEHEKTAARDVLTHTGSPLSKKISGQGPSIDPELSLGGNQTGPLQNNQVAGTAENITNSGIDARALISQIEAQAKKTGRVRIALTPPRMGKLDMDVVVRDNKVQVVLKAENTDVWHALKSNTTSLESALRNQGLMVDTIQVTVQEKFGDTTFGFGQNTAAFKEGSNQENNPGHHPGEPDAVEYGLAGSPEENTGSRLDGQISLFI